jgi:non-ribosomal peptide synthetase component F
LVTHQNLVNSTFARIAYHEPIMRLLLLTPFALDASVGSILGTLCQGGTLVLPEAGVELEITSLINLIAQHQVSHFVWAPVLYALLLENATAQQLSSLCAVTVGGESYTRTLVERHYELLPHASLFNDYGPTEGTVWSSVYQCQPQNSRTTVPIGRPIANVQIYLLDAYLQPVPIGVAGELYIGGAGVARGYLNRPDLTAERFIANPFSREAGGRLYKTGDVARYLPTGDMEECWLMRWPNNFVYKGNRLTC